MQWERNDPAVHRLDIVDFIENRTTAAFVESGGNAKLLGKAAELIHVEGEAPQKQRAMLLVQRDDHVRRDVERTTLLFGTKRCIGTVCGWGDQFGHGVPEARSIPI
jgi:hypothetical protein